jgi:DNA-directed RNA polymerase alpha subunit
MQAIMNKDLSNLGLSSTLLYKLRENNINNISDLQKLNRADLRNMKFDKSDIDEIIVKLELMGTDLNKRR